MFRNYEKIFYEIKNTLLDSDIFKKLVFYNTPDSLNKTVPTKSEAEKAIYIKPIIYVYEDSPEFGLSTFISIGLVESIILDGSINSSIKISVACDRKIWELNENRVRPLAILSEISNLDNLKLETAGKLVLRLVKEIYFNNDLVGYTALFEVLEEKGSVVNEF